MANQQSNPKGTNPKDRDLNQKRPIESETSKKTDEGYEGSSGSMSGSRQSRESGDLNRDVETDHETTKDVGRTMGSKTEREH